MAILGKCKKYNILRGKGGDDTPRLSEIFV